MLYKNSVAHLVVRLRIKNYKQERSISKELGYKSMYDNIF